MNVIGQIPAIVDRYDANVMVGRSPIVPSLCRPSSASYHAGPWRHLHEGAVLPGRYPAYVVNRRASQNVFNGCPWGCAEAEPWEF